MNNVTERQLDYIRSLASERTAALAANPQILQRHCITSRDASAIIDALKALPTDPREVDPSEQARIDALRGALPTLSERDASFARSLISQWDERGRLSERQWPHVEALASATPKVTVEPGVFVLADGTLIAVYRTRNGHLAGKVYDGEKWIYTSGAQRTAANGRKITAEEAAAFGRATGCCVFCARELTDDRSVEVGYGPVCAANNELPWGELATAKG
jgi:hypothetical protein